MFSKHLAPCLEYLVCTLALGCKATSKLSSVLCHSTIRDSANGLLHREECRLRASTLQPELAPLGRGDPGDNGFLHQGIIIVGCYLRSGDPV